VTAEHGGSATAPHQTILAAAPKLARAQSSMIGLSPLDNRSRTSMQRGRRRFASLSVARQRDHWSLFSQDLSARLALRRYPPATC